MPITRPQISIVMDSFNQAEYIEKSIRSVVDQNYPNLDFIIFDGGSTDRSVEIIKKYENKITYWQSKPDGGQVKALNAGIAKCSGDIIGVLDSDDMLYPGALDIVGEYFAKNPGKDWLGGGGIIRDAKTGDTIQLPKKIDFESLLHNWNDNWICQPSIFWRKSIWDNIGAFDETFNFSFDYEFWLRLSKHGKGGTVEDILSISLRHWEQKTQKMNYESFVETNLAMFLHGARDEAMESLKDISRKFFKLRATFSLILSNSLYQAIRNWQKRDEK
jgi:glycosyltransferase involved in cell wall biosynthesis